jgi:hypothetical protein
MDNDNFFYITEDLDKTILEDHPEKLPSPDEIFAAKEAALRAAIVKLEKLGLTEEEAKAIVGL